jgi:hypothetical protein
MIWQPSPRGRYFPHLSFSSNDSTDEIYEANNVDNNEDQLQATIERLRNDSVGDWTGPTGLVAQMARPVRHSNTGVTDTESLVKVQNKREREKACVRDNN